MTTVKEFRVWLGRCPKDAELFILMPDGTTLEPITDLTMERVVGRELPKVRPERIFSKAAVIWHEGNEKEIPIELTVFDPL
jgi:hypothetical protein